MNRLRWSIARLTTVLGQAKLNQDIYVQEKFLKLAINSILYCHKTVFLDSYFIKFAFSIYLSKFTLYTGKNHITKQKMKTVISHSTQTRKAYRKPVLVKIGNVISLTKGKLGSAPDIEPPENMFSPD